jgi:hypothetical protein
VYCGVQGEDEEAAADEEAEVEEGEEAQEQEEVEVSSALSLPLWGGPGKSTALAMIKRRLGVSSHASCCIVAGSC